MQSWRVRLVVTLGMHFLELLMEFSDNFQIFHNITDVALVVVGLFLDA